MSPLRGQNLIHMSNEKKHSCFPLFKLAGPGTTPQVFRFLFNMGSADAYNGSLKIPVQLGSIMPFI